MRLLNKEFSMEYISKLEKLVLGWAKNAPHLPAAGQKWLGANVWWIALVGAIISGIAILVSLGAIVTLIGTLGAPSNAYYVTSDYTSLAIMTAIVSFVFLVANGILLALAVKPLQEMQKKGWVLLFLTLLVEALSVVVHAVLSFSVVGFIIGIIFGAVGLAISAYFIAEIHDQFGHRARATVKKA
ncbi:MAG: hypothetical protein JWN12_93 [Candidatus Saccharibacteria bacterium]|nr:hypothetical protein [Candidatus Saccharibacteria bacterium]